MVLKKIFILTIIAINNLIWAANPTFWKLIDFEKNYYAISQDNNPDEVQNLPDKINNFHNSLVSVKKAFEVNPRSLTPKDTNNLNNLLNNYVNLPILKSLKDEVTKANILPDNLQFNKWFENGINSKIDPQNEKTLLSLANEKNLKSLSKVLLKYGAKTN